MFPLRRMSVIIKRRNLDAEEKIAAKKPKSVQEETEKPNSENEVLDIEDLSNEVWRPPNWVEALENIREMRKDRDAPVDTMGCDKCMDNAAPPEIRRFHALVSLMLSSQTKDELTFAAMERLKAQASGLSVNSILAMPEEDLRELIFPVGYWKRKAKFLKETAKILKEKYNNDIPDSVELLQSLPGVGPKMAHICMKTAWGVISGIGVDVHVHRIANRIGWVKTPTKTPEQTRQSLESWLPRSYWDEINNVFVGFGQQICKAIRPMCSSCLNQPLCPYGKQQE